MLRRTLVRLALAAVCVAVGGCLPLPVRTAPGVTGRVVDASTRKPLAGALVVVRFDGRHGELSPDREQIGHAEARSDAAGRFSIARHFSPGLAVWPFFQGETRVVAVMAEGYRCARPQPVAAGRSVQIALPPAADHADQRESCRPVAARPGEATAYMTAWRALFDESPPQLARDDERRLEQLLSARTALGFGENCEGPVLDLALSPGGELAALATREPQGTAVHVVELAASGPRAPLRAGAAPRTPPRRLGWLSAGRLVLWEPSSEPLRTAANARVGEPGVEVIWRASQLPKRAADAEAPAPPAAPAVDPLEPEDIHDDGASRWDGRGFTQLRGLDPLTGLPRDELRIVGADGGRHTIALPGEACGPIGHFGRPQYRIASDARHAVDLRYVDGGCRGVWIDLDSGAWKTLEKSRSERGVCRTERRIPPGHLGVAVRGYLRQVEESLEEAGIDPTHAYVLRIDASGRTQAETRGPAGEPQVVSVAPFPIQTPLQIVHVSNVAPLVGVAPSKPARRTERAKPAPPPRPEPVLEPL